MFGLIGYGVVAYAATTHTGHTGTPAEHTGLLEHTGTVPAEHTGVVDDTGPDPDTDSDEDGWTVGEGDCADNEPLQNPGMPEVCFDRVDNDCSSLVDEGCDDSARLGSLGGGGACTGGGNIATSLVVPFALLLGRRRSA
jgi:hypothetical protein